MSNVKNEEINKIHDTLTDLLCSTMKYVPYEEPKEGDWCYEMTSLKNTNRDCRIGILKNIIDPVTGEFETVTIGEKVIHWNNAKLKKIPSDWLR